MGRHSAQPSMFASVASLRGRRSRRDDDAQAPQQHPAGWSQPQRAAIPRWFRLLPMLTWIVSVAGVLGWIAAHDPAPGLRLSGGGWVTVLAMAGTGYLVWQQRRTGTYCRHCQQPLRRGGLPRWAIEAVVPVVLVVSLLTLARAPAATPVLAAQARVSNTLRAAGHCPSPSQVLAWLSCLRRVTSATPDSPTTNKP